MEENWGRTSIICTEISMVILIYTAFFERLARRYLRSVHKVISNF